MKLHALLYTALLLTPVADACPLCHTPAGQQVRAGLFNGSFGTNLIAIALPFPVFAGIVVWLHFVLPRKGKSARRS